eukprot:gene19604-biopygen4026
MECPFNPWMPVVPSSVGRPPKLHPPSPIVDGWGGAGRGGDAAFRPLVVGRCARATAQGKRGAQREKRKRTRSRAHDIIPKKKRARTGRGPDASQRRFSLQSIF